MSCFSTALGQLSAASTAVALVIVFNGNIAVMSFSRVTVNKTSVSSSVHT